MADVFTRMIVGWEMHPDELAQHGANLMTQTYIRRRVKPHSLVLHSGNGGTMKSATLLAILQRLGAVPLFSRPSVRDGNPY